MKGSPPMTGARGTVHLPRPGEPPPPGRALVWMALSVALAVVPTFAYVPLWGPLYFFVCAGWRWRLERKGAALPGTAARVGIFALGCVLIAVLSRGEGSSQALALLLVLVSLKLLEMRTRRDYVLTALLAYFLVLSGFFFDQSLPLALYTVCALVLNTFALAMACGAAPARPSFRLALALCGQTVPIVVALFIFFPRLEGSLNLFSTRGRSARAGVSDRLVPGELARLAENEEMAFRAELPKDVVVSGSELYWRGPVLVQCDGLSWFPARSVLEVAPPKVPETDDSRTRTISYRVTIEANQNRWLFALDRPVKTSTKDAYFTALGSLEYRRPLQQKLLYTVTSRLSPTAARPLRDLSAQNPAFVQLPKNLGERVRALANSWKTAAAGSDVAIVARAREFFRTGGFVYSLSPGTYEGPEALEEFLFSRKRGFCEHYAAAFSTLLRAAGVPSRVVIGYQGGNTNWLGSHLTVHQSDAHAWSEVWLLDRGWTRIDPTGEIAPDRLSLGAESFQALARFGAISASERLQQLFRLNNPTGLRWLVRNVSMAWDTLDHEWNLRVIGFSFETQGDLLRDLGIGRLGMFSGAIGLLLGLGVASGGFALFLFLRTRRSDTTDPRANAVQKVYARFCTRLARAGVAPRRTAEGPIDFAQRAVAALPAERAGIAAITDQYIAMRFGAETDGLETLRRTVRRFRPRRRAGASAPAGSLAAG